jgi:hypothetical protein
VSPVRRRELLAAAAGATVSLAGCAGSGDGAAGDGPVTVETLDAPGSDAGTLTVPPGDRVAFVEFFATTCSICAAQMTALREAHRAVDDAQFLSVTSQPVGLSVSRTAVVEWWRDHDGAWPVGLDEGTALARRYDATSVPTAVVLAPDGTATWTHRGRADADSIVRAIRDARAGESA